LIKTVAATAEQTVAIGRTVSIEGVELPRSALVQRDGKGRMLVPYSGGAVPRGEVFLHSGFVGSYDSRYFGPVPATGILGLAEEVFTYAP
jgi:type IV secretory pathway protease TraF